jgi:alkylation response protein AidB-like acyl-CoA dehydrogenase
LRGTLKDPTTLHARAQAVLSSRFPRRGPASRVQVLGAGNDDLEAGRALLVLLADHGWATPAWPESVGGIGDPALARALAEEIARFAVPDLYPFAVGLALVGPVVASFGTAAQQTRWLDPIRRGEQIWCQLFSEPDAGSDLAGLATRARLDGNRWIVTGQKVWSSRAHYSDWGLLLARTDPDIPKHAGITCFALPMHQRGVVVRPLRQMNGDTHFSEVFLDEAVIEADLRIGPVGDGWRVATATLAHERAALGTQTGGDITPAQLLGLATTTSTADPVVRQRLVEAYIRLRLLELTEQRAGDLHSVRAPDAERASAGAKLRKGATFKEVAAVALSLGGPSALLCEPPNEWTTLFLTAPSLSIRGGTDEIQRNVVGERVLGLPRDPRLDTRVPFRELVRTQPAGTASGGARVTP